MDPSGTFVQCDARAIGSASEGAQSSLQEVYHKVPNTACISCDVVVKDIQIRVEESLFFFFRLIFKKKNDSP